jgi:hypothetical protein
MFSVQTGAPTTSQVAQFACADRLAKGARPPLQGGNIKGNGCQPLASARGYKQVAPLEPHKTIIRITET